MTRTQRIGVAAGSIAVAALLVGLWLSIRSADRPSTQSGPAQPAPRAAADKTAQSRRTPVTPQPPGAPQPSENPGAADQDDGTHIVREHSADEPARPVPLQPFTVAQVRSELQPQYRKCVAPLRGKIPPVKGRLIVTAKVKVSEGHVSVTDVTTEQIDLDEPEVVDCVTKAALAVQFDSPAGQADVEHTLKLPFAVP